MKFKFFLPIFFLLAGFNSAHAQIDYGLCDRAIPVDADSFSEIGDKAAFTADKSYNLGQNIDNSVDGAAFLARVDQSKVFDDMVSYGDFANLDRYQYVIDKYGLKKISASIVDGDLVYDIGRDELLSYLENGRYCLFSEFIVINNSYPNMLIYPANLRLSSKAYDKQDSFLVAGYSDFNYESKIVWGFDRLTHRQLVEFEKISLGLAENNLSDSEKGQYQLFQLEKKRLQSSIRYPNSLLSYLLQSDEEKEIRSYLSDYQNIFDADQFSEFSDEDLFEHLKALKEANFEEVMFVGLSATGGLGKIGKSPKAKISKASALGKFSKTWTKIKNIKVKNFKSKGSTGRIIPNNLKEKLVMDQVKSNPNAGIDITPKAGLKDPRWLSKDGWVKMSQNINDIEIHYLKNIKIGVFDDFKFID